MASKSQGKKRKLHAEVSESESSEHPEDLLSDETSDSECEYEAASRQIGRNAARETLSGRSREQYTTYQQAMVSWGQQQNAALPVKRSTERLCLSATDLSQCTWIT